MRQMGLALEEPKKHGGRRKGAGRKPGPGPRCVPHRPRQVFERSQPLHITLRVAGDVRYLRNGKMYALIRKATITAAKQKRCHIVHASIQQGHVHLIVEAEGLPGLAKGMQSFQVAAAKRINSALSRAGRVFADRYHAHVLRTPGETRNAIRYVLCNWRKHGEGAWWAVDAYSSGYQFRGWKERASDPDLFVEPRDHEALQVHEPRTWLLQMGWRRAGAISAFATPVERATGRRSRSLPSSDPRSR